VLPFEAAQPPQVNAALPLAALFGSVTLFTTLGANGVPFLAALISGDTINITADAFAAAVPGTVATCAILGTPCCSIVTQTVPAAMMSITTHRGDQVTQWSMSVSYAVVRCLGTINCSHFPPACLTHPLLHRAYYLTRVCHAAAHEVGHAVAAKEEGAELAPPLLLPAGLGILGTFGSITIIRSTLRNRAALLRISSAGPAAGAAVSGMLVLIGLAMSAAGLGPLVQVSDAFPSLPALPFDVTYTIHFYPTTG
jgi:hypothetical protein